MKLSDLADNTEFTCDGYIFRKESLGILISKSHPDATPDIEGKRCHKVSPKMGGQFQPKMGKWFPDDTEVSVYHDRF